MEVTNQDDKLLGAGATKKLVNSGGKAGAGAGGPGAAAGAGTGAEAGATEKSVNSCDGEGE